MITDHQFMRIAEEIAVSSKCVSLSVGAAIVKDNRIISHGYNGTPAGYDNCDDVWDHRCEEHTAWSIDHEIHAEMNAIIYAAKAGLPVEDSVMYCTTSPCRPCLKHLKQSGIQHVYYKERYYQSSAADEVSDREFCNDLGIGYSKLIEPVVILDCVCGSKAKYFGEALLSSISCTECDESIMYVGDDSDVANWWNEGRRGLIEDSKK